MPGLISFHESNDRWIMLIRPRTCQECSSPPELGADYARMYFLFFAISSFSVCFNTTSSLIWFGKTRASPALTRCDDISYLGTKRQHEEWITGTHLLHMILLVVASPALNLRCSMLMDFSTLFCMIKASCWDPNKNKSQELSGYVYTKINTKHVLEKCWYTSFLLDPMRNSVHMGAIFCEFTPGLTSCQWRTRFKQESFYFLSLYIVAVS